MSKSKVKNEMINLLKFCRDQPELFNKLYLKRPAYWSRQIDLCRSVVEYRTTVAYSGNMTGKDHVCPGEYYVRLVEELRPLTYGLVARKTKLMPKDEWAAILGHSPDVADALIQSMILA